MAARHGDVFGHAVSCAAEQVVVFIVMPPYHTPLRTAVTEPLWKRDKRCDPWSLAPMVQRKGGVGEVEADQTILVDVFFIEKVPKIDTHFALYRLICRN